MRTLHTTYEHDFEFEGTSYSFVDDMNLPPVDDIKVKRVDDDRALRFHLAWLVQDDSYQDFDWQEGVLFEQFTDSLTRDAFIAEHTNDKEVAFIVDNYSHSGDHYSLANTVHYPDRRWDVAPRCVIVIPTDFTDPRASAVEILAEYSDWVAGDVYGIVQRWVTVEGEECGVTEGEECWGYIGNGYAETALAEVFQ